MAPTTLSPGLEGEVPAHRNSVRLARLLLLVAVVWLIATHVDAAEVRRTLIRLKTGYLLAVVLLLLPSTVLLRALRWRSLLPSGGRRRLSSYVGAYVLGILANVLLLGKLGDLVKARLVCDSQVDYGRSLAVVVIDRLLEGLALVLLFAVVLLNSSLPAWAYQLAWIAGAGSLGALIGLRILFRHLERFLEITEHLVPHRPAFLRKWLLTGAQRLLAGCEALADDRRVLVALLYALAAWALEIVTVMIFLATFGIPAPWFVAAVVVLVVLNFGTLVPISPGSVGVYQLLCVFALSLWGVDRQLAFAFGVGMQVVLFVPVYLVGFVWLLVWNKEKKTTSSVLVR